MKPGVENMEYHYLIDNRFYADACIDYHEDGNTITLNLIKIEYFAKGNNMQLEHALSNVISHEVIHACIRSITNRDTSRMFDTYCHKHEDTAIEYSMY